MVEESCLFFSPATATAAFSSSFTVGKALVIKHGIPPLPKVVRRSVLNLICTKFTHFEYQRICLRQEYKFSKAGEREEITALMIPCSHPENPFQTLSTQIPLHNQLNRNTSFSAQRQELSQMCHFSILLIYCKQQLSHKSSLYYLFCTVLNSLTYTKCCLHLVDTNQWL